MGAIQAAARDPRAIMAWREAQRKLTEANRFNGRFPRDIHYRPSPEPARTELKRDWSIYLGVNGTAPNQYPAKFTFDTTANPSCINDFVIFPINAPGTAAQPNIVAFNYLYSGTTGGNGVCNRKASGSDSGTAAEVMWSYGVQGGVAPGAVETSPVISYDPVAPSNSGTKVAFVESVVAGELTTANITIAAAGTKYKAGDTGTITGGTGTLATYTVSTVTGGAVQTLTISYPGTGYVSGTNIGTTATSGGGTGLKLNITAVSAASSHFHVLAWGSGASAGQNSSHLQSVFSPAIITTFSSNTPTAGSGAATELNFSSATDTLSPPFVDYVNDLAYVGDDSGVLYRIKNVFCTSVNLKCTSNPVPSLDTSWGTNGGLTVCSGQLTGPVLDFVTGNVFVGCSDGKLYMVSQGGTIKSVVVGDGVASETYGGIVDPPLVDGADGFVYAVSGSGNGGANGILLQAKTDLSSSVTALIGVGNQCNIHEPTPNNTYFTSITTTGALMYVAGLGTTGTVNQPCTAASGGTSTVQLYGVTFGAGGTMTAGAPSSNTLNGGGGAGFEWSPLLEFYNATTSTDWLFISALQSAQNNFGSLNITNGFPTGFGTLVEEGVGASGMVVDNAANTTTYAQAASLYFNALQENAACTNNTTGAANGGCAVKLTQAALQ